MDRGYCLYMKLAGIFLCALAAGSPEAASLKKLNVMALDNHGQPVTDLQAGDFHVFEDGKPKETAYFRFTGGRKALPPTVILIDMLSDRVLSDSVIGREVGNALKKLETSDDVYLYFLTNRGEVFPIHGLPEEGDETSPSAVPWTQNAGPMIDGAVKKFFSIRPVDDYDPGVRFQLTSNALDRVSSAMQRIPGRKNLVWVTHGVPLYYPSLTSRQPVDLTKPMEMLAEKLAQAQIAVYAVQQSRQGAGQDLASEGAQSLDIFCSLTGGRKWQSDTADAAITQARTDSRASYEVDYYTDAVAADGKRHKLRVNCARKDVRLQTEQEYYALGPPAPAADFEKAAFEDAVRSPLDATEIGVRARVSGTGGQMQFDLQIDTQDLLLRRDKDHYVGNVLVVFSTDDDKSSAPLPLKVDLTAQQYEAVARGTIPFEQSINVSPAVKKVRAIVVDTERRAVGSVTIPIRH
jgi:VWFA-related protein